MKNEIPTEKDLKDFARWCRVQQEKDLDQMVEQSRKRVQPIKPGRAQKGQ